MKVAADPLVVGIPYADNPLSGTTAAARPELAGTILEDVDFHYSFSSNGFIWEGNVQNRVVRSDVDNTIDFYWRIKPNGRTNADIMALRLCGFGGFLDGDYRADGLGDVGPGNARAFGGANLGCVNFIFSELGAGDGVSPGETSYFFFLDTKAHTYAATGAYDLVGCDEGCLSPSFATFAPALPEPSSLLLLGVGLLGLGGRIRRQQS